MQARAPESWGCRLESGSQVWPGAQRWAWMARLFALRPRGARVNRSAMAADPSASVGRRDRHRAVGCWPLGMASARPTCWAAEGIRPRHDHGRLLWIPLREAWPWFAGRLNSYPPSLAPGTGCRWGWSRRLARRNLAGPGDQEGRPGWSDCCGGSINQQGEDSRPAVRYRFGAMASQPCPSLLGWRERCGALKGFPGTR